MVFSSLSFLCFFLPAVLLFSLVMPDIWLKNVLLLAASLIFYAYGEPVYVFLLIASAFLNYCFGLIVAKRKSRVWIGSAAAVNIIILIVFKYSGFLVQGVNTCIHTAFPVPAIRLPIGISFFTFQAMSYVIDVYRAEVKASRSFGKVLLYLSFFPQLIAGPIVKYHDIECEMDFRVQTVEEIALGMRRFSCGLVKKVLLANTMGLAADTLFGAELRQINILTAWIGAVSYMFQIYFDFSGYSDMAIGMGQMFGFHFRENFRYPYCASSIREFWRRWHISLSSWFRDYLYIPLGGNRKGARRAMWNRFFVFLCTGIWHGANVTFLVWGVYHGLFLGAEAWFGKLEKNKGKKKAVWKFLRHMYALLVVCVGFVIFRAETLTQAFVWIRQMFCGYVFERPALSLAVQQLTPLYLFTLAACVLASFPLREKLQKLRFYEVLSYVAGLAGLILCILNLAGNTYNPFIYFQF